MPDFGEDMRHKDVYLGEFIEYKIFKESKDKMNRKGYREKSGTIKDKISFCRRATSYMDYYCLTKPAKDSTEAIYKFIIDNRNN